ncbi:MAG: OmpA family protein [Magnetococcales bacterium]|nr:OmpA family protein [Magnetococcales bacterium]MBF0151506.1 OmpA family protein [Magnetococcales bacterium]MBF0172016.1 OmpA family protein [Magnetococcales bacterium]MBF0348476.1 OmpA family protein [Magnetococcales bacterium]MBF0632507.1 OmpA family protein [Magnetococcales bacterium]
MRIFRLATLTTVGLLTLALSSCVPPTVREGWDYDGFKQWHPQAGKGTVGKAGTQCYFCERSEEVMVDGDADGDGVKDSKDKCPNTPKGFPVDAKGCPLDSDGDGVVDGLDQCPGTPPGTPVDKKGCPMDSDGDGVYDHQDQCPGTPVGAHVNHVGCWVLENLHFDIDKAVIKPIDFPLLDNVLDVLNKNPGMRVEIQGHTDSTGSRKHNQKLSEKRAESVRQYLVGKGIAPNRTSTIGHGLDKPVADNNTLQGRSANRRVQLEPVK